MLVLLLSIPVDHLEDGITPRKADQPRLNQHNLPTAHTVTGAELTKETSDGVSFGAVAGLVGIEGGVVSGVINLESSGVEASDWRLRHDQAYHEA